MKKISVDLSQVTGVIKPMHAVNNGPRSNRPAFGFTNIQYFQEAGFPYSRNHDANQNLYYCPGRTVDVAAIFQDFDADENDPANYDFAMTDDYCKTMMEAGMEIYYRLGSSLETYPKKYNVHPPKDYAKWARICEHIIRHYCYGWADGFQYKITYWEIWNEADYQPNSPTWTGTLEQFYELYKVAATYLKGKFPELKIGGPAFTDSKPGKKEVVDFLAYMREHQVPLDFFSFHQYTKNPRGYALRAAFTRQILDEYGFKDTEVHLNEWNYLRGWMNELRMQSHDAQRTEIGTAFNAASMLACQKAPMDLFMYYDCSPGFEWNGLFESYTLIPTKPYYAFWQFNKLYRLGNEVASSAEDENLYVGAARKDDQAAIQIAYYAMDDCQPDENVEIELMGMDGKTAVTAILTDDTHTNVPIRKDIFITNTGSIFLTLKQNTVVFLTLDMQM